MDRSEDPRYALTHLMMAMMQDHPEMKGAGLQLDATSSGCPMIRISFPDGGKFNVTVTRARA
jgi:hypothetical protein